MVTTFLRRVRDAIPVRVRAYLFGVLLSADFLLNSLLGGHPGETLSSRAAKARRAGRTWGCIFCRLLDAIDHRHCERFIQLDRGEPAPPLAAT